MFHPVEDSSATAEIIVKRLMEWYAPASVLDLGCNVGAWTKEFRRYGVRAIGVDGPGMDAEVEADLREPLDLGERFDLVLCLEVAEHLEPESASVLVDSAVRHADRVIWSAATPGQGGYRHVNEQPHGYWARLFKERGFIGDSLTQWLDPLPHDYYRANLWHFHKCEQS